MLLSSLSAALLSTTRSSLLTCLRVCYCSTCSLRRQAGVSAWSVVSRLPSTVSGKLSALTPCLSQIPPGALKTPTILVLQRLAGRNYCAGLHGTV